MSQQERPTIDRVWEFTKDISTKVSKQAEKHWKINTLRVQIASIKHRKNNSCKELGQFVYESLKSNTVEEDSYKASLEGFFAEIQDLDHEILERNHKIEILASEHIFDDAETETAPTEEEVPSDSEEKEVIQAEPVEETTDEVPENASQEPAEKPKDKVDDSE